MIVVTNTYLRNKQCSNRPLPIHGGPSEHLGQYDRFEVELWQQNAVNYQDVSWKDNFSDVQGAVAIF